MDHTQLVVFGLGEHRLDSHPQPLGEVLEPGVGRGLQDDRVPCQEDAPGFVLVPVVPALLFRQLDRGAAAGGEGDLVDLAGSLDGEAASAEGLVDCGDVLVDLGAEAELARTALCLPGTLLWSREAISAGSRSPRPFGRMLQLPTDGAYDSAYPPYHFLGFCRCKCISGLFIGPIRGK